MEKTKLEQIKSLRRQFDAVRKKIVAASEYIPPHEYWELLHEQSRLASILDHLISNQGEKNVS